jgi:hypothetical protein
LSSSLKLDEVLVFDFTQWKEKEIGNLDKPLLRSVIVFNGSGYVFGSGNMLVSGGRSGYGNCGDSFYAGFGKAIGQHPF